MTEYCILDKSQQLPGAAVEGNGCGYDVK